MISVNRRQASLLLSATAFAAAGARPAVAQDDDDLPVNVFISPAGQPFRARPHAPYPVVDWFKQADKNADGKLDHGEFIADAAAFFTTLDRNGDGVLDGLEIQIYERRVAPEILGYRVAVSALDPVRRFWRAQYGMSGPHASGDHEPQDHGARPDQLDESRNGAAPFGFFEAPEPVTAADTDFRGVVKKASFLALADRHFGLLDVGHRGYLTLDSLPKTIIQRELESVRRRR